MTTRFDLATRFALAVLLAVSAYGAAFAVDDVNGNLFTLTDTASAPNGAWSWFSGERAIVDDSDPNNPRLILSSISAADTGPERGDVDVLWRNLNTGVQGHFELNDQLENDDHNSAAFYIRPDGRYLAVYGGHFNDQLMRYRISTDPHDPTSWSPEVTLDASPNNEALTYSNVYNLPEDNGGQGRLYNFTRTTGWDPNVLTSDDDGSTWTYRGKVLTEGSSGDRPYLRYASDGKKIHFTSTEKHPINFQGNSIYHGYIRDGALYNTYGEVIDQSIFDANGKSPTELTPVFTSGQLFNGTPMTRAWTSSTELDNTGNPVITFSARANDDSDDRRLFYGRFDGAEWHVHEMAKAGDSLYNGDEYTGLSSVDPSNPNVVYMSTEIDPITGVATTSGMYEIYKGVTADFGKTWSWSAITENSTIDNVRPIVPEWDGESTAVTWMRGDYFFWEDNDSRDGGSAVAGWNTEIVGVNFAATDPKSLLWKGSAGSAWNVNNTPDWDSGGGTTVVYNNGDEVAFDDTATATAVNLAVPVAPNGVAFNNSAKAYTVTGPGGIGGSGALRVLGGGITTLNNGSNTYTGNTLVARGTLALAGATSINSTPEINVRSGGTLDVANLDSTFQVASSQVLGGDGNVTGDTVVQSGATLRIGDTGKLTGVLKEASSDPVTYVDAAFSGVGVNTTLADGTTLIPVSTNGAADLPEEYVQVPDALGNPAIDRWQERPRDAANGGSVFVAPTNFTNNFDVPVVKTTISGLTPGAEYSVFGFYFGRNPGASDAGWDIQFGLTEQGLTTFEDPANKAGVLASELTFVTDPNFVDSGVIDLLQAGLGVQTASPDGTIEIFVNDGPSIDRSWYEGVGYSRITIADGGYEDNIITFSVDGDLTLDSGSTTEIEIFASNVLDRLDVTGTLEAGGALEVSLAEGAPALGLGDAFDVLDFVGFDGAFDAYMLPALSRELAWDLSQLTTTGVIRVGLPGDFNGDNVVDAADYTVWRDTIGQADATGVVDNFDYTLWEANYGMTLSETLNASHQAAIPEPSTLLLILGVSVLPRIATAHQVRKRSELMALRVGGDATHHHNISSIDEIRS